MLFNDAILHSSMSVRYIFISIIAHFATTSIPEQDLLSLLLLSTNPVLQEHKNDPFVLVQLWSHGVSVHSLMSKIEGRNCQH